MLSTFTEFPVPTPGGFPTGIINGGDGNLWFGERQGAKVGRITTNGVLSEFPLSSANTRLWGLTVGPDGNVWFGVEGDGVNSGVGRITPSGAMTLFPVLPASSFPDVATGPDGNLWVTEGYHNQIAVVSPSGVVLNQFNVPIPGGVLEYITAGPDGNLWFTDVVGSSGPLGPVGASYVGSVSVAGNFTVFPLAGTSSSVKAITTGPDGNLWFVEQATNKIGRLTPSGVLTEFTIPTANSNPDGLCLGPDGNLWFVEISTNQIASITPSGLITEYPIPTPNSQPYAIATGPDGELWFTEGNANQIGRTNFFHAVTSTALTASPNPTIFSQTVTLTATVTPSSSSGGTPTGTVTFYDGATQLGQPVPLTGGSATLTTASLAVGQHSIATIYNGDPSFHGSLSSASEVVQPGTINLTLGQAPATAYLTDPVTFTVSAQDLDPSAGDPQATVSFFDGSNQIGSAPLVMSGSTGTATFTTTALPLGANSITVGLSTVSGNFVGNVIGPQNFSVTMTPPPPSTTTVTLPSSQPIAGLPFTLTATVATPAGTRIPTGTVTFYDGAATLGTATLGNGTATASGDFATATLTSPAPAAGAQLLRAVYNGIQGYGISSSLGPRVSALAGPVGQVYFGSIAVDASGDVFSDDYSGDVNELRTDGSLVPLGQYMPGGYAGLAVDQSGDLFIGFYAVINNLNTAVVDERRPDGSMTTVFSDTISGRPGDSLSVAVDSAGDLFVAPNDIPYSAAIYEVQPNGKTTLVIPAGTIGTNGPGVAGLAADAAGNVYVDGWVFGPPRVSKIQPDGTLIPLNLPLFTQGGSDYTGFAVDSSGDFFGAAVRAALAALPEMVEARPDGTFSPLLTPGGATAVDNAGSLLIAGGNAVYRVDMTPNLTVSPLQSSDVQTLLNSQSGFATMDPISSAVVSNMIQAINGLGSPSSGTETVTLDLGGGTFTTDTQIQAPAGVTVVIQNGTLVGGSPALVVNSGNVVLNHVQARNATNAPTIVVNGGSLWVRNSSIQESTGYAQAALQVNGGTVDLGTNADPGGNILNINGAGALIQNTSGRAIPAVGDTFENNGVASAPSIFVLNPTASGALTVSNNTTINVPGVVMVASTSPTAVSIGSKGQVSAWASGVPVADPLAGLTGPSPAGLTNYGAVVLGGNSKVAMTINPGIYSQINVSGNASLTLNPGTYIIEGGGLVVSGGASVSGTGVMIYNAGSNYPNPGGNFGGVTLSGSGTFNLSAPTSGPYAGLLIFQSHENTRALSISGSILTGMSGTIYAPSALLSLTGGAQLQAMLDVGMLNVSGGAALTEMAAGSDGSGDTAGIANTLLAGNLSVYVNDPSGLFTADERARIQDAINTWDAILGPYNVTITAVSDPTAANLVIDTGSTSACGSAANGVLGCFNSPKAEITILQGWNWYAGSDPTQIASTQYDFETTVLHELGHALGLGGSTDPTSPMNETLAAGVADRTVTPRDLNIPDPPQGADPQMAAGSAPRATPLAVAPSGLAAAPASGPNAAPTNLIPLSSSSVSQWPVVGGRGPAAVGSLRSPLGPESMRVIQGTERQGRRGFMSRTDLEATDPVPVLDLAEPAAGPKISPEHHPRLEGTDRGAEAVAIPSRLRTDSAADSALNDLVFEMVLLREQRAAASSGVAVLPADDASEPEVEEVARDSDDPWLNSIQAGLGAILLWAGLSRQGEASSDRAGNTSLTSSPLPPSSPGRKRAEPA